MSATDSTGYFIELGENNLIIARTNLSQRPRTVDELREVWLGDNAAVDGLIAELKPAGTTGKAVTLLRLKPRAAILADSALAQKVKTAAAAEDLLKEKLGADYTSASWAWAASKDGRPPENGAQWILDATPLATAEEAIAKVKGWSFELLRSESAPISLAGALAVTLVSFLIAFAIGGAVLAQDAAAPAASSDGAAAQGEPRRFVIRFLTEGEFPPFNYYDDEGVLSGFNVDLARAICLEANAACEREPGGSGCSRNSSNSSCAGMSSTLRSAW